MSLHDKMPLFLTCTEVMMRAWFGTDGNGQAPGKLQQTITRQMLKLIGGDDEASAFVQDGVSAFTDRGISPVWMSPRFTLTPIAFLAHNYLRQVVPPQVYFLDVNAIRDDQAFFGFRVQSVTSRRDDAVVDHILRLAAIASTKAIMTDPEAAIPAAQAEGERIVR